MTSFFRLLLLTYLATYVASQQSHKYLEENIRLYRQPQQLRRNKAVEPRADVDYRLPTSAIPESYYIRLLPDIDGDNPIQGFERINFNIVEATSSITLHTRDITVNATTVQLVRKGDPDVSIAIGTPTFDDVTEFYVIPTVSELEIGAYELSMEYEAILSSVTLAGFYRSTYEENGEVINLGTTQFESTDARRAFPCFDEPSFKATYQIEMGREDKFGAISNMPLINTTTVDGINWDLFEPSLPMSTYLVAFVVSDFVNVSAVSPNGTRFSVWSRPEAIYQADYALEVGPNVIAYYEGYFDVPFPLPKQDMAALPDFDAGAMENWGLITYRETALLFDPVLGSASNKQRVTQVISHELAHMWFGDLVTLDWWNDLWLNEGFATYVEYIGMDFAEPEFKVQEQYVALDLQSIFRTDALKSTHPLRQDVQNPSEISYLFDGISYSKGSAVIRMMNYFLSEPVFRAGLTNYLEGLSYQTATQFQLWEYLDAAAQANGVLPEGQNVNDTMNTWTLQDGFPVVNVNINGDGTAQVSQKRFFLVEESDSVNHQWYIPLTYQSSNNPDFSQTFPQAWMTDQDTEITLTGLDASAAWTIFNIQQVSYYRVNYDSNNWAALSSQLAADHLIINVKNRAQLIDDSLNLARAGQLEYDVPFELSSYLSEEESYTPWYSALSGFGYIEEMFTRTSGYQELKDYLLESVVAVYEFVGFEDDLEGDHTEQLLRSLAVSWACDLKYEPCLGNASLSFASWMDTPDDFASVSPNLKSAVYCTAIAEGGDEEWDFAWGRYEASDLATERSFLLYALGCSKDIPTLSSYLDMAFTEGSGIRSQDSYQAYGSVADNDVGRDLAWDYLLNNYQKIADFYGSAAPLQSMAATASDEFNTQSELLELRAFKQVVVDLDDSISTSTIDTAIEEVELNIEWMNSNYDYIVNWLDNRE